MNKKKNAGQNTALSAGLLTVSIMSVIVISCCAIFSISMSGTWIPILVFGIPLLISTGAIFFWFRGRVDRCEDRVRNEFYWKREVISGILILYGVMVAWIINSYRH